MHNRSSVPRLVVTETALLALLLTGCGGDPGGESTTPVEEMGAAEEGAAPEEGAAEGADDAGADAGAPPCEMPATAPAARRQTLLFRRWLQDQSVGRQVVVEAVAPQCGNAGGSMILHLTLRGPAGGLMSLGRALEAYYPGASRRALGHERLDGPGYRLRLRLEVRIPVGASPRPRCTWDPSVDC